MSMRREPNFRAFTVTYQDISHRIITDILVSPAFDPSQHSSPPYEPFATNALWDTGATGSVITPDTAKSLNLIPTGTICVQHAGGQAICNTYVVNFYLPNHVAIIGVPVVEGCSKDFGAIVGMDIITRGDFSITNLGNKTIVSYRVPSVKKIDYVIESHKIAFAGVGRNDPCPCGSKNSGGRPVKYKNCCLKKLSL